MAKKEKNKNGASVQTLLGVKTFSEYGIVTARGEMLFFHVTPSNISVLSSTAVENKIPRVSKALMMTKRFS